MIPDRRYRLLVDITVQIVCVTAKHRNRLFILTGILIHFMQSGIPEKTGRMGKMSQVFFHIPRALTIIVVLLPKWVKVCFVVTYVNKLTQYMISISPLCLEMKQLIQIITYSLKTKIGFNIKSCARGDSCGGIFDVDLGNIPWWSNVFTRFPWDLDKCYELSLTEAWWCIRELIRHCFRLAADATTLGTKLKPKCNNFFFTKMHL